MYYADVITHLIHYTVVSICKLTFQHKGSWPYDKICIWGERFLQSVELV